MQRMVTFLTYILLVILLVGLSLQVTWAAKKLSEEEAKAAGVVAGEITAIANQLHLRPETALDFTKVSGEYCLKAGFPAGSMTHYAVDPKNTQEDVVDFIDAEPLIKAGLDVNTLPRFPGGLGSMKSGQWYFLPAGEMEPHHGIKFKTPLLIRGVNIID